MILCLLVGAISQDKNFMATKNKTTESARRGEAQIRGRKKEVKKEKKGKTKGFGHYLN